MSFARNRFSGKKVAVQLTRIFSMGRDTSRSSLNEHNEAIKCGGGTKRDRGTMFMSDQSYIFFLHRTLINMRLETMKTIDTRVIAGSPMGIWGGKSHLRISD